MAMMCSKGHLHHFGHTVFVERFCPWKSFSKPFHQVCPNVHITPFLPNKTELVWLDLPLIINFPDVLLSSASNMYLASSSYLADFTIRVCLFSSTRSSNLSSFDNSCDPFSQRKLLGSLEISSSNLASSFSYTCTSASGVTNETGSSVDSDRQS